MHPLLLATQHVAQPAWKAWAYVGAALGLAAIGGIWQLIAQQFTAPDEKGEYSVGLVPTALYIAGVIMLFSHVFDLKF